MLLLPLSLLGYVFLVCCWPSFVLEFSVYSISVTLMLMIPVYCSSLQFVSTWFLGWFLFLGDAAALLLFLFGSSALGSVSTTALSSLLFSLLGIWYLGLCFVQPCCCARLNLCCVVSLVWHVFTSWLLLFWVLCSGVCLLLFLFGALFCSSLLLCSVEPVLCCIFGMVSFSWLTPSFWSCSCSAAFSVGDLKFLICFDNCTMTPAVNFVGYLLFGVFSCSSLLLCSVDPVLCCCFGVAKFLLVHHLAIGRFRIMMGFDKFVFHFPTLFNLLAVVVSVWPIFLVVHYLGGCSCYAEFITLGRNPGRSLRCRLLLSSCIKSVQFLLLRWLVNTLVMEHLLAINSTGFRLSLDISVLQCILIFILVGDVLSVPPDVLAVTYINGCGCYDISHMILFLHGRLFTLLTIVVIWTPVPSVLCNSLTILDISLCWIADNLTYKTINSWLFSPHRFVGYDGWTVIYTFWFGSSSCVVTLMLKFGCTHLRLPQIGVSVPEPFLSFFLSITLRLCFLHLLFGCFSLT